MSVILPVLSIICVLWAGFLLFWRVLEKSGVKLPEFPEKKMISAANSVPMGDYGKVFAYAALFRLCVIAAAAFAFGILVQQGTKFSGGDFLAAWDKWDAVHYMRISHGYSSYTEDGKYLLLVFYPLYAWLLRIFNTFIPNIRIAALILSTLSYSGACCVLYALLTIDYSRETAAKAIVLMSVFPFSIFDGAIMSESVFLLTSGATLYFIRKHNWALGGIFGLFAALSRSCGVFLIFPATAELMEHYKIFDGGIKKFFGTVLKNWLWLLLMPLGTCIYLYINYRVSGNPLEFLTIEKEHWFQSGQMFFVTMKKLPEFIGGNYDISFKMCTFVPGVVLIAASFWAMIYGARRHRTMYSVWLAVYTILNISITWPISICRYISCSLPLFVILGELCERKKALYTALLAMFAIFFGIILSGYFMGKQIM